MIKTISLHFKTYGDKNQFYFYAYCKTNAVEDLLLEQIREQLPCCTTKCLTSGLAIIISLLIKIK